MVELRNTVVESWKVRNFYENPNFLSTLEMPFSFSLAEEISQQSGTTIS